MADEISYLFEPEGSELHWDGLKAKQKDPLVASVAPSGKGMMGSAPVQYAKVSQHIQHAAPRPMTHEELQAMANQMLDKQAAQTQGQLGNGPSVGQEVPSWLRKEMGE